MKKMLVFVLVGIAVFGIVISVYYKSTEPQRNAINLALDVCVQLNSASDGDLLKKVALPPAYKNRTDVEKLEFMRKALRNEISKEGLKRLRRKGEFGPLLEIFPENGKEWAAKAGVSPESCVAYRLEKGEFDAQLVICTSMVPNRIVRVNNIRQLADLGVVYE